MGIVELKREVDLIVPRGGREFVEYIRLYSKVPCSAPAKGLHVYVDEARILRWRAR